MMKLLSFVLMLLGTLLLPQNDCHVLKKQLPKLLVVCFDGFRHDYVHMAESHKRNVSAFRMMMKNGVHANYSKGIFPSVTLPSHMTMATGLYTESHGIISNEFYDPKFGAAYLAFPNQTFESKWWDNGQEPIWIGNERQGHRSAVINWVGFDATYGGRVPTYSNLGYAYDYDFYVLTDRMTRWLELEHTTLGMLYYEEPDESGHKFGPNSKEILDQIEEINARLAYILERVQQSHVLRHSLNIMIVSDHGMTELSKDRIINFDELVPTDWYDEYGSTGCTYKKMWPKNGKLESIYQRLKGKKHLQVWKKEEIPQRFHFSNHRRIAPIFVLADLGWCLKPTENKGTHGYDNNLTDMHPTFMASGPAFRRNLTLPVVYMIDYYNIMCTVLDLKPRPNNGSMERIQVMLAREEEDEGLVTTTFITYIVVLVLVMLIGGIFSLAALQQIKYHYIHKRGRQAPMAFHDLQRLENGEHTTALLKEGDLDDDELSDTVDLSVRR